MTTGTAEAGRSALPDRMVGLTSAEARRRRVSAGPNRWVAQDRFARVKELLALLLDPMAIMLALAATVYALLGETRDAVVLAAALIPVLGVDVVLEARSRAALEKLAKAAAPFADVVRDGHIVSIAFDDVVPGDILVLREGKVVAADGVVRHAANLAIDESSLTGESEPQSKHPAPPTPGDAPPDSRFFAGSQAVSGHGFGEVITTGPATQYGAIATLVGQAAASASPLQRRVGSLVQRLGTVAAIVAVGLFVLGVIQGQSWTSALLLSISLAMAAIPEEFPIVLTLFLSVGAWRLASRGMLVRRLAAVETLGSTTVICTDKTGTLTRGEFRITRHVLVQEDGSERALLEAAVLACERHPTDTMERAILAYAEAHGITVDRLAAQWKLVRDYDFDATGKHMSHVWREVDSAGGYFVAAKGAVEGILAHTADGADRVAILEANAECAAAGLRVLAVAAKRTAQLGASRADDEQDLTVYGLLGFEDPLRAEVPDAVAECQAAGIRVVMITGDHALTAHAIAEHAGLAHEHAEMVTGDTLAAMPEGDRTALMQRAAIFARISPQQKYAIVDALKRAGAVVAMTGDGVNDAPALRRADIGIAMGQRGTDVARATADLVLLDDNFASIVHTIAQGRHIFQNIQRAFLYLLAFHLPIIVLAIAAPLLGVPLMLLPIHLVWLELIVHPVSAIVFQAEAAPANLMQRPPRVPTAPLLPRSAVIRSSLSGVTLATATLVTYVWALQTMSEASARALGLTVLVSGYQVLVFAERLALPGLEIPAIPRTRTFWLVWGITTLSVVVILYAAPVADTFRLVAPGPGPLALAVAVGCASVGWRACLPRANAAA